MLTWLRTCALFWFGFFVAVQRQSAETQSFYLFIFFVLFFACFLRQQTVKPGSFAWTSVACMHYAPAVRQWPFDSF